LVDSFTTDELVKGFKAPINQDLFRFSRQGGRGCPPCWS